LLIEIGAPASLPLGLVQIEHNHAHKTCLLGFTLQHPPVQLSARKHKRLSINGARANKGYEQAFRFLEYHNLQHQAEVEIELSIPAFVGLGSDAMLGLSIAQALSWLHGLPLDNSIKLAQAIGLSPNQALEVWGYDQGGLLLVDTQTQSGTHPEILQRQEIAHKERKAWAFVFYFPRISGKTPAAYEAENMAKHLSAAPHLSSESGRLVMQDLLPAVNNDDITAFGRALNGLQEVNRAALQSAGTPLETTTDQRSVLDLMKANGALAWGQSLSGLCLYALVEGGDASRALRMKLQDHIGYYGGRVMATITDNSGARYLIKDENGVVVSSSKNRGN
jgi:beta-RFAP synthase